MDLPFDDEHTHTGDTGDHQGMDPGAADYTDGGVPVAPHGYHDPADELIAPPHDYQDGGDPLTDAATPSPEEIEAAKATLRAAGADDDVDEEPDGTDMSTDEIRALQDKMQDNAEDAQMLSNIASMQHNTAMGIIGNMR